MRHLTTKILATLFLCQINLPFQAAHSIELNIQPLSASQESKLTANDGSDDDYFGKAVSLSGNRAVIGAAYHDPTVNQVVVDNGGAVYYYEFENDNWVFKQKITASDAGTNDQFGNAVSLSGDRLMVGSFRNDEEGGDAGAVYVFEYINSSWVESDKLTASDANNGDWFGQTIAMQQNTAMIGATSHDGLGNKSGAIYVFNHDGQNWAETQKLTASNGTDNTRLGSAISLSNNRMVAGATYHTTNGVQGGAAYVFEYNTSSNLWQETQQLLADAIFEGAIFGHAVSIDGDKILIGAIGDSGQVADTGAAYLFENDGQNWTVVQKFTEAASDANDEYGSSVSVVGNRLYIGSQNAGFNGAYSGAMFAYDLVGEGWQRTDVFFGLDTDTRDEFGVSISTNGGRTLIGAHRDTEVGNNAGSAYVMQASFPVTVTVTGLATGSSFILQNNGADDLTITENGTTLFTQKLYSGEDFTVTVASHPSSPNQSCAVKQVGTQITPDGNNQVQVTCVYTPYFVAGHVINLIDGNQITLQNNQTDDLIISQRGAFVFPLPLNDSDTYEVTIASMPSDPIQPCTVNSGQGTIKGSDVNDVVVSCQPGNDLMFRNGFETLDN